MNKFKSTNDSQLFLLPPRLEDFVPDDHLAHVIDEVVEILNTRPIEDKYSALGQKSYHPKSLIKLLFYGYSIGVMSGRKIARQCTCEVKPLCTQAPQRQISIDIRNEYRLKARERLSTEIGKRM